MTAHTLWTWVNNIGAAAVEAGVITRELQFSPHLFRRSYATLLYKSGMKLKAIENLTRHANIETLCKHYVDDSEPAAPISHERWHRGRGMIDRLERFYFARLTPAEYQDDTEQLRLPFVDHGDASAEDITDLEQIARAFMKTARSHR